MRIYSARRVCAIRHTCQVYRHRSLLFLAIATSALLVELVRNATLCVATEWACLPVCRCSSAASQGDCLAESTEFVVRSFVNGPRAGDVARHCDTVCKQLRTDVFNVPDTVRWRPKCNIVLHATRKSYLSAVERGGSQTIGSSTISLRGGRVTQRRIDLLAEHPEQGLAALPHELVHILFADACPTTTPPKWAEEGLALLFDPADKRVRHRRDLNTALQNRTSLSLNRLLTDIDYPVAAQRAAFYAQSLSLVEYLTQLESPTEFVQFAKLSTERGPNHALSEIYGLNTRELERRWKQYTEGTRIARAELR